MWDNALHPVTSLRAQGGTEWLDLKEGPQQIGNGHSLLLEQQAQRVGGGDHRRPMDDRAAELAPAHRDKVLGLQDAHGLAERGLAHPEPFAQLVLVWQERPVWQLAGHNGLAEFRSDDLGHAWLPKCRTIQR